MTDSPADAGDHSSFADFGKELWDYLTGKGAAINYQFVDMKVGVPRSTGADSPRAIWSLDGTLRITTAEGASQGMTSVDRRLSITADLRMEVGGTAATVTASGGHVVVHADSPATLWSELNQAALPSAVGRVSGPRAIGRAAELLRSNGLDVRIEGPDGVLVRLGTGVHSSWGRPVFGSSAVQLVSIRSLRPIATAALQQTVPVRRSLGVIVAAGVAIAIGLRLRAGRHERFSG